MLNLVRKKNPRSTYDATIAFLLKSVCSLGKIDSHCHR